MGVPGPIEKKQGVKMIELFINKWSMIRLEQKLKFAGFTILIINSALGKERLTILLRKKVGLCGPQTVDTINFKIILF